MRRGPQHGRALSMLHFLCPSLSMKSRPATAPKCPTAREPTPSNPVPPTGMVSLQRKGPWL